jgi:A118 family predicted phage portal protein
MTVESIIKDITGKDVVALNSLTETWLQYYQGDVLKFHHYEEYNGNNNIKRRRKTLNMPKKICEDWANLLLNEKTEIVLGNPKQQDELWKMLNKRKVKFWTKGNKGVEKTFALGTGAFVESVDDKGELRLQFVNAQKIYPITIDQDDVTECAFVNVNSKNTIIQIHLLDDNGDYVIRTLVYQKEQNNTENDIGNLISNEVFETRSPLAWFQIFKPNIANNIDLNSPMGISIYANALDVLQGVDLAYDGFCEEMRLGRSRIFVNKHLIRRDENGETKTFDNNESGFYYGGENENAKPFEFYSPTLRTESYFNGINNALNLLSSKVGFGENHYRFDGSGITTATQVISENSEMFRTLKKHEIILNEVIIDVCKALMYIHNTFTDSSFKFDLDANIEVKFDDSIIEDKETMKMTDRQDVNMGVMSKVEYRMKWYNEDEETAREKIAEIEEQNKKEQTNWFSEE